MALASNILLVSAILADLGSPRHDGIFPVMMILLFMGIVVGVGLMRMVIKRELRRRGPTVRFESSHLSAQLFEPPGRWLAIRAQDIAGIQSALRVRHPRACSWSDALATPFEPRLFISPPVRGWIIVMGCDLPDPADDIDACFKFLANLSHKLGEVQFFFRNRAVGHHGWARLSDGKVLRAYAWADETLWNQGELTEAESELRLCCLPYTQDSASMSLAERELFAFNTERVVRLAAIWSLDPTAVEGAELDGQGIAGDLLSGRFH